MNKSMVLLLALFASGCGLRYHAAMYGANRANHQERWDLALARYEKARDARPDSEEAERRWLEVRDRAIEQAIGEARVGLDVGDYELVLDRLAYAEGLNPDLPEVYDLRRQAEKTLVAEVRGAIDGGRAAKAYAQAVRLKRLFPSAEAVEPFFSELRTYYVTAANAHLSAKAYEDALATIAVITEYEPEQQDLIVAPVERRIRDAWATDLARQARQNDRWGHDGAAMLQYARAWEVAAREEDRIAAQRLADQLRDRGKLTVSLKITGNRARAAALRKQIAAAVEAIPEATMTSGRADLPIYLSVPTARCSEKARSTRKERPYISGKRDVPNPAHVRLTEELARLEAERDDAHGRASALWNRVEQLEGRLAELDADLDAVRRKATSARGRQEEAQKHIAAALRLRDERAAELEKLGGTVNAERRARTEEQLVQLAQNVADWQDTYMAVDREAIDAERRVAQLEPQRRDAEAQLERVRGEYTAVMAERDAIQAKRDEVARNRILTAPTVEEDVHATFAYQEKEWTRRCVPATWAAMRPRWESALGGEERYVPVGETVDIAHVGHAPSDLEADPKAYAERDSALIAKADAETGAALAAWVGKLADDHFRVAVDDALSSLYAEPRSATTALMALYLGSPTRLDPDVLDAVQTHIGTWGVEDLDGVLTGGVMASR